jgi:caa(3)-type oxidase subunit IV
MAVLIALLFFTLLTVGASQAEEIIAHTFHVIIPAWVNVCVALSIAVVKTALVVLFFMQLKYDNPTNGMIFIFCIMTVAFFLGFTMLDMGNRGTIDRFKEHYIIPGGTGIITTAAQRAIDSAKEQGGTAPSTAQPVTKVAADAAKFGKDFNVAEEEEWTVLHKYLLRPEISNAQQSRPKTGPTLPEFAGAEAKPAPGAPAPTAPAPSAPAPAPSTPPPGGH